MIEILDLYRLSRGIHRMDLQTFRYALERSCGMTSDYADGCFIGFKNNPLGYMVSRNPQVQGEELLRVAWELGERP